MDNLNTKLTVNFKVGSSKAILIVEDKRELKKLMIADRTDSVPVLDVTNLGKASANVKLALYNGNIELTAKEKAGIEL